MKLNSFWQKTGYFAAGALAGGAATWILGRSLADPMTSDVRKPGTEAWTTDGGAETQKKPVAMPLARPFPEGQAYAWLKAKVDGEWSDWQDNRNTKYRILQWLLTMDAASAGEAALALEKLGKDFPGTAKDWFREEFLRVAVVRLAQLDSSKALEWLDRFYNDTEGVRAVIATLAEKGEADIKVLLGNPEDGKFRFRLEAVTDVLAKRDPAQAAALLGRPHFTGNEASISGQKLIYDSGRCRLVWTLAQQDPQKAISIAAQIAADSGDGHVIFHALNACGAGGLEWAKNYSGPGAGDAKAFVLVKDHALDLSAARSLFDEMRAGGASGEAMRGATTALAGRLADQSIESARDWLASQPPGVAWETGCRVFMPRWLESDPAAASAWVNTLPASEGRDAAVASIISVIKKRDPSSAWEWASSISNQSVRHTSRSEVIQEWKQQNPEAAAAALAAESAGSP